MNEKLRKINDKIYTSMNYFFTECGGITLVFVLAFVGIACAIVGFYGKYGFDWKWFLCLHLPLYIFCGWALWKAIEMYMRFIKDKEDWRKQDDERNISQQS